MPPLYTKISADDRSMWHMHTVISHCLSVLHNSQQVTITDTPNDKYILITIPVLLGEIAPVFEDAVDGNITVMVPESTRRLSVISTIRVSDPNNGN